jgi:hypothetical protein
MLDYLLNEYVDRPEKVLPNIDRWTAVYERLTEEPDVLERYPADYVYCGPRERLYAGGDPTPGTLVTEAFHQGDVTIYALEPGGAPDAFEFPGCSARQSLSN